MNILEVLRASGEAFVYVRRADNAPFLVHKLCEGEDFERPTSITWLRLDAGLMGTWFKYPPPLRANYFSRVALHELSLLHNDYELTDTAGIAHAHR